MHSSTCMDLRVQCRVIARTLGSKSRSFNHAEDDRNCASAVHVQQCAGRIGSQGSRPAARAQRSSLPLLIGILWRGTPAAPSTPSAHKAPCRSFGNAAARRTLATIAGCTPGPSPPGTSCTADGSLNGLLAVTCCTVSSLSSRPHGPRSGRQRCVSPGRGS